MIGMQYHEVVRHAHTGGLMLLVVCFVVSVVYALWPANRENFKAAARVPLESDDNG